MNNSRLSFIVAIAAVAGIVLGGVALSTALSNKKVVEELKAQVQSEATANQQARDEIAAVRNTAQEGLNALASQVVGVRDQMTNAVARAVAAATAKPVETKPAKTEVAGKKGEKEAAAAGKKGDKEAAAAPAGKGTYHTVVSGDTPGRIAKQYGTTVDALTKLNPGLSPTKMKLGQKIRVK
jgi:LysM repeat protein